MSTTGEDLVLTLKTALKAAELELRGVPAVAEVHKQVTEAIRDAEEWQHRFDAEYYRYEGQHLHPW